MFGVWAIRSRRHLSHQLFATILATSLCVTGTTIKLTGKATSMDIIHALGQFKKTSSTVVDSRDNMVKDMTPDINSDIKNEKV